MPHDMFAGFDHSIYDAEVRERGDEAATDGGVGPGAQA